MRNNLLLLLLPVVVVVLTKRKTVSGKRFEVAAWHQLVIIPLLENKTRCSLAACMVVCAYWHLRYGGAGLIPSLVVRPMKMRNE